MIPNSIDSQQEIVFIIIFITIKNIKQDNSYYGNIVNASAKYELRGKHMILSFPYPSL